MTLHQIDPLIRELIEYRDLIQQRIDFSAVDISRRAFFHSENRAFALDPEAEDVFNSAASREESLQCGAQPRRKSILGPGARDLVIWTDNSVERDAQDDVFTRKYTQMHWLVKEPDNEITLYVGAENWPLPIPHRRARRHMVFRFNPRPTRNLVSAHR